jgi:hypothetical protein
MASSARCSSRFLPNRPQHRKRCNEVPAGSGSEPPQLQDDLRVIVMAIWSRPRNPFGVACCCWQRRPPDDGDG